MKTIYEILLDLKGAPVRAEWSGGAVCGTVDSVGFDYVTLVSETTPAERRHVPFAAAAFRPLPPRS